MDLFDQVQSEKLTGNQLLYQTIRFFWLKNNISLKENQEFARICWAKHLSILRGRAKIPLKKNYK